MNGPFAFSNAPGAEGDGGHAKYQALNILSLLEGRTQGDWPRVEVRAIDTHRDLEQVELLFELFQSRLNYLRGISTPLPLLPHPSTQPISPIGDSLAAEVQQLHDYATAGGMPWSRARRLFRDRFLYEDALREFERTQLPTLQAAQRAAGLLPCEPPGFLERTVTALSRRFR